LIRALYQNALMYAPKAAAGGGRHPERGQFPMLLQRLEAVRLPAWAGRFFPFLQWVPMVTRKTLADDLMAGLTGAIVVLPQGVAFATIAGMPPEYGLYTGVVPAIIAALFGSSWHLVSGPTTAASIVLFSALSALAEPGTSHYVQLALTLAFMVGAIQLAMGLFRLGALVNFISHSVVIGFTAGAGILIAANQAKNFFGIPAPRASHLHEIALGLAARIDQIDPAVTAVALATLASGLLVRRFFRRVPYMIVAMLVGSGLAAVLNEGFGMGVPTVGALPATLPPLSAPTFSLSAIRDLAPAAVAVTLFALTEAVSISRALAVRAGQQIDGNQEFIGQGLSNLVGSFFSSYVATGSFNRSGLNYEAGAKTPVAAISAGAMLAAIVVMVAPLAAYLPKAAMAAILFVVGWGLIDLHHIKVIVRTSRSETAVLATTFLATLFLELELAILAGVLLSLLIYLIRTSRPRVHVWVPDPESPERKFSSRAGLPECPQVKIVRVDGSLFFGAVNWLQERLRAFEKANPDCRRVAIDASGINFIDVAGAEALAQEARRCRRRGGRLYLIHVKEGVCEPLRRGGYIEQIGPTNVFQSKSKALAAIVGDLDRDVCRGCERQVFRECPELHRGGA
jgi:SulP family sulfate permease